ncbi:MAG: hypothetical protein AAGF87_15685, partial [Bacteroidota bacterium]
SMMKLHALLAATALILFLFSCENGQESEQDVDVDITEEGAADHTHEDGTAHSHSHSHGERGDGHSHYHETTDRPPFTYLSMTGEFHMNPGDSMTQNDRRNPSRLELTTSDEAGSQTTIAFYAHSDMNEKLAECGYEFIGSRPDPHYYPDQSKTSIWDVFKKMTDISGDCMNYEYVISRSPHGDPIHMHLRYGQDVEALLAMSNDEEDDKFNPWWATYCDIDRTTACD